VKLLIDRYSLPDPAEGKRAGEFSSPELQKLYDELLEQGSKSRIDALKAGALVEEMDIMDLRKAIGDTKNEDLRMVFRNLERGSIHHLGAFGRQLSRENVLYEARHMNQDEADSIMNSGSVQGSGRNRGSAPGGRWRN